MIVSCPNCATRYTLSDSSVGANGRKVRCSQCGHTWWQQPAADEATQMYDDFVTEMRPSRPGRAEKGTTKEKSAKKRSFPKPDRRTVAGWGALALLVAAVGAGGYVAREPIVHLWPPAALLYRTVGLPVDPPGTGLEFRNVKSEQKTEGGTALLIIEGQIANVSDLPRAVPRVRAEARDPEHKPVQSWVMEASPAQLLPGEIAIFRHAQPVTGPSAEVSLSMDGG